MNTRIIITKQKLTDRQENYIVTSIFEDDRLAEIVCEKEEDASLLGNIYIGKVKNIVKNLNAAFIQISPEQTCYYSIDECHDPIYVKKQGKSNSLVQGDEIVVQISKEAIKTKDPVVTTNIALTGQYVILSTENKNIGISNKMSRDAKKHYKELLEEFRSDEYGFIVRTNAKGVPDELVISEVQAKIAEYHQLTATAIHRTCYSCLKKGDRQYMQQIQGAYREQLELIQTDDEEIYNDILDYCKISEPDLAKKVSLYTDSMLSLSSLKNIRGEIDNALKERVWLRSGAYLVIQPTEALTVVDVNSGKKISKNDPQANFFEINIEAAKEIAHQLRLRNISGICIIDFIDMISEEYNKKLIQCFIDEIKRDPIPVNFVEMTKLGLVEITRKKVRKSLAQQLER